MKILNFMKKALSITICIALVFTTLVFATDNATPTTFAAVVNGSVDLTKRAFLDGTYIIRSAVNSNLVLTVGTDGTATNNNSTAGIFTNPYVIDNESQIFLFQRDINGKNATYGQDYGVRAINSNCWLNHHLGTTNTVNQYYKNSACYESTYQSDKNLNWYFTLNSDGTYTIRSSATTTMCLQASSDMSTRITCQTVDASNSYQKWILEPVCLPKTRLPEETYVLVNRGTATSSTQASGTEYLETSTAIKCLNDKGGMQAEGNVQQLYRCDNTMSMYYVVEQTIDGYYTFASQQAGRYIRSLDGEVELGGLADGTPADNEKWVIMQSNSIDILDAPGCSVINFSDGNYMDTANNAVASSTIIQTDALTTKISAQLTQSWHFHPHHEYENNYTFRAPYAYDTDVYASTFDTSDTVTMPIKVFDYRADGMLFEHTSAGNRNPPSYIVDVVDKDGNPIQILLGNNNAFSLTGSSQQPLGAGGGTTYPNGGCTVSAHNLSTTKAVETTQGVDLDLSQYSDKIGYTILETLKSSASGLGFLESELSEDGLPVYKQEVVEYIATALEGSLQIERTNSDGTYNNNYVNGESQYYSGNGSTLASSLRWLLKNNNSVNSLADVPLGTYADTVAKHEQINLLQSFSDIQDKLTTYTDVAFYLMNSIFVEDSYNKYSELTDPDSQLSSNLEELRYNKYTSLVLTKVTHEDGTQGYIFDSAFTDNVSTQKSKTSVVYNSEDGSIRNTSAAGKHMVFGSWGANYDSARRTLVAKNSFLPVRSTDGDSSNQYGEQIETVSPNLLDTGVVPANSSSLVEGVSDYDGKNFNFVLQSEGSFVYHESDDLFFDFDGDDDVYLFFNDHVVLDIGGCHSTTHASFKVNDYVNWAWSMKEDPQAYALLSDADKERVEAFAIYDGDTVDMNFFYMERHGRGSNMRIFTNIEFSSSDIDVDKTAYQYGDELAYDGIVMRDEPIEYGFTLTNTSNHSLFCLGYDDKDIGITIDYKNGLTVTNPSLVTDADGGTLDIEDLIVTLIKDDGTRIPVVVADYTTNIKQAFRRVLGDVPYAGIANVDENTRGLPSGWGIEIRGIYYTLTDKQKEEGAFLNKITGSGYAGMTLADGSGYDQDGYVDADNIVPSGTYIYDVDTMRVRMPSSPVYYEWEGHEISITKAELVEDLCESVNTTGDLLYPEVEGLTTSDITKVVLSSSNGRPMSYSNVTIDSDTTIRFTYDTPGIKTFYITLTYINSEGTTDTMVAPMQVFVTDVEDMVYVLDYGLPVELTADGMLVKDDLTIKGRNTDSAVVAITDTQPSYSDNSISFASDTDGVIDGAYGEYAYDDADSSISYTPQVFMQGADTIWSAVRVSEVKGDETVDKSSVLGDVDIHTGVEMYKSITVIPANVVYYEDSFTGALTYNSSNTIEVLGDLSTDVKETQSDDQSFVYGYDDGAYSADTNVQLSHGTCRKIPITSALNQALPSASFSFEGTGFELISRTNATDSANIMLQLCYPDKTTVKNIPVITEFDHGADGGDEVIYQVPIIRVEGLDYGEYTIKVFGVPSYNWVDGVNNGIRTTYLYIDGVRIYNPLNSTDSYTDYYGVEKGAKFTELRDLVLNGKAATALYDSDSGLATVVGDSYITENRNEDDSYESNSGGFEQLNIVGPNNELYLDATETQRYVVLNVKKSDESKDSTLQIAVHDIDEFAFNGEKGTNTASSMKVSLLNADGTYSWSDTAVICSGTEQYYNIDYSKCPMTDDGYYQVVIAISGFVSLTNVKHNNIEFKAFQTVSPQSMFTFEDESLAIFDKDGNQIEVSNENDYLNLSVLSAQIDSKTNDNVAVLSANPAISSQSTKEE